MLTKDQCYQAVQGRDTRFDGMFFTAVHSTGIFCRPSCPARTPLRMNVDFYRTAAAAAEAGFRACKRCRPDASPGSPEWDVRADVTGRAMRLIRDGVVDRAGVTALAGALGYSTRQLGRVMQAEIGAGPLAIARNERARTARTLIDSSSLSMSDIAFASGFSSIRQFNDTILQVYGTSPSDMRNGKRATENPGELVVRLAYRPPADLGRLFSYLATRAVAGIEDAGPQHYTRSMPLAHCPAVVTLRPGRGSYVECRLRLADNRDLGSAVARARRILDLDADPQAIEATVIAAGFESLVRSFPGTRSPGQSDPVELAIRTVLGQQISIRAATTHLNRLVARHGTPLPEQLRVPGVESVFPDADTIAQIPEDQWALPTRRIATIRTLARTLAEGNIDLGPGSDREEAGRRLGELPGIGPWTIGYISMRALGDPDVFLGSDLGVKKAIQSLGLDDIEDRVEACSPWRSYLTHLLWAQHANDIANHDSRK